MRANTLPLVTSAIDGSDEDQSIVVAASFGTASALRRVSLPAFNEMELWESFIPPRVIGADDESMTLI